MRLPLFAILLATGLVEARAALACDQFIALDAAQAKELMATLKNPGADQFDRIFAFETLVCSDRPVIRDFAMKEGLANAGDDMVRAQVLMEIMFQKERYRIRLIGSPSLDPQAKKFIEEKKAALFYDNKMTDKVKGCVSLYGDQCRPDRQFSFKGTTILLRYDSLLGEFRLQEDNTLAGTIREHAQAPDISAEIVLFE